MSMNCEACHRRAKGIQNKLCSGFTSIGLLGGTACSKLHWWVVLKYFDQLFSHLQNHIRIFVYLLPESRKVVHHFIFQDWTCLENFCICKFGRVFQHLKHDLPSLVSLWKLYQSFVDSGEGCLVELTRPFLSFVVTWSNVHLLDEYQEGLSINLVNIQTLDLLKWKLLGLEIWLNHFIYL